MKFTTELRINGKPVPLINYSVVLNLFGPGRADFTIKGKAEGAQLVEFHVGYDPQKLVPWFIGYTHNINRIDQKQDRILCRELSGVVDRLLPISLRNVGLPDVLAEIKRQTELRIVLPKKTECQSVPYFYSVGTGFHVMPAIGKAFGIKQFIWQQQGDGSLYVGPWSASYWCRRKFSEMDEWKTGHGAMNSAKVPAVPWLRPGAKIGDKYLTQVLLSGVNMMIHWSKNPWGRY